jgi:hypothetical protein
MLRKVSLGFLFAALVAACGSARVVQRTQYGGVIALNGDRAKAMEQADKEMSAHCGPGNYQVVREGEVPVGTDSMARSDTYNNNDGSQTQTAGQSTRTATEWRVEYQCGQGAGGPPPGGQPPQPPPPQPQPPPPQPGY